MFSVVLIAMSMMSYNQNDVKLGERRVLRRAKLGPMNREQDRSNKIITVSLLFGCQLFAYMIRYALSRRRFSLRSKNAR